MFDKTVNDKMNSIIQSDDSATERAFVLFTLMNETCPEKYEKAI